MWRKVGKWRNCSIIIFLRIQLSLMNHVTLRENVLYYSLYIRAFYPYMAKPRVALTQMQLH